MVPQLHLKEEKTCTRLQVYYKLTQFPKGIRLEGSTKNEKGHVLPKTSSYYPIRVILNKFTGSGYLGSCKRVLYFKEGKDLLKDSIMKAASRKRLYRKSKTYTPGWVKMKAKRKGGVLEDELKVEKFKKIVLGYFQEGYSPLNIGHLLRDVHGVRIRKLTRAYPFLDQRKTEISILERKIVGVKLHLKNNRKDIPSTRRLNALESKLNSYRT